MNRRLLPLLVAALVASGCGAPEAPPPEPLTTIPYPELGDLEPLVRDQLIAAREGLESVAASGETMDEERSEVYGLSGMLYHTYDLLDAAMACYRNAAILAPGDYRWAYLSGRALREAGEGEAAMAAFRRALELQADDLPALIQLAELGVEANRLEEAEAVFLRATEAYAGDANAWIGLGQLSLARREFAAAVERFETVLRIEPEASIVQYPLGLSYRGLGQEERAREHLQRRGNVVPPLADPLMDRVANLKGGWRLHVSKGSEYSRAGTHQRALVEYRKAYAIAPDQAIVRVNLGFTLTQLGDLEGAKREFEEAVRLDPSDVNAQFNLGTLCARLGDDREAVQHYDAALALDPELTKAHFNLANALRRLGRFGESARSFRRVLERDPASAAARAGEVYALIGQQQYREAVTASEEGLSVLPGDRVLRNVLARVLAAAPVDDLRDGPRALALAQALLSEERSLPHIETAAMAAAETGAFDRAIEWQESGIRAVRKAGRDSLLPTLERNLELYRRGEPCRVPWTGEDRLIHPRTTPPR